MAKRASSKSPQKSTSKARKVSANIKDEEKKVTPDKDTKTKTSKPKPYKYWVCELRTGKVETFDRKKDLQEFEKAYDDIVVVTHGFSTKKEMNAFLKSINDSKPSSTGNNTKVDLDSPPRKDLTSAEMAKRDAILSMVEANRPSNEFVWYWKTTKFSEWVILLLRFLTEMSDDSWSCKPNYVTFAGKCMIQVEETQPQPDRAIIGNCDIVKYALTHFEFADQRDHTQSDPNAIKHYIPTPKKGQYSTPPGGSGKGYPQCIGWTKFKIPVDRFNSIDEETVYITQKVREIGQQLKSIMLHPLFNGTLQRVIPYPSYFEKINNQNNRGNYIQFASTARVRVEKLDRFIEHVTKKESEKLTDILWEGRYKNKKYKYEEIVEVAEQSSEDEGSESGEEEEDEKSNQSGSDSDEEEEDANTKDASPDEEPDENTEDPENGEEDKKEEE